MSFFAADSFSIQTKLPLPILFFEYFAKLDVGYNVAYCFHLLLQAGKTLSVRKWQAAFTPEGYLDIGKTLSRIQRGVSACLHDSIAAAKYFSSCSF